MVTLGEQEVWERMRHCEAQRNAKAVCLQVDAVCLHTVGSMLAAVIATVAAVVLAAACSWILVANAD